jgi:hypothetical protein
MGTILGSEVIYCKNRKNTKPYDQEIRDTTHDVSKCEEPRVLD